MKKMVHTTIKLSVVGLLASSMAYFFNIENFLLVGIIGILSISPTIKDSIQTGIKRVLSALYGLSFGTILFMIFGFEYYVWVIFLPVFVLSTLWMKIDAGIVPSIVLVTHVFAYRDITWIILLKEVGIITIGIGTALIVNTLYPKVWLKSMIKNLNDVDQMLRDHLYMLSLLLSQREDKKDFEKHYAMMIEHINQKIIESELMDKDKVFSNDHRYLAYLYMRRNQFFYINNMYASASKLKVDHPHTLIIAKYIQELIIDIGKDNKANFQMDKLNQLKHMFENEALPKTRAEFETRAMLYNIVLEMGNMHTAKLQFHERYSDFYIKI